MFTYRFNQLNNLFSEIIRDSVPTDTFEWLRQHTQPGTGISRFNSTFVMVPRKTGRSLVLVNEIREAAIDDARRGLKISGWTIDRLTRVWMLMQLEPHPKENYFRNIENLFLAAEVNELVALYSALPVLAYPEIWKARCAEGIRNNIGDVLTAIMCNNPYPAENLDEPAWNQLVLKAFFTEKPIEQIVGLDLRTNQKLAYTLSDYAHERWAAHRKINPQLWRCVAPYIDANLLNDLKKIATSDDPVEREAAALASYWAPIDSAKTLIPEHLKKAIESGELSWDSLAVKMRNYVLQ